MSYRNIHKWESVLQVLFVAVLLALSARAGVAQEPAAATCKTAIVIWVPTDGGEIPLLRADKEYVDRATCISNKARREGAAAILEFRASAAGAMPPSRCAGVREALSAEGIAPGDPIMSAEAINEAYGEEICPPDPPVDAPGTGTGS